MGVTRGEISPCQQYIVSLTEDLTPIPGTMRALTKIHKATGCNQKIATVYPYQVAYTKECRPASGLRYFYQYDNIRKRIVSNSMIALKRKPARMCVGTNTYLEFIVQSTVR